VKDQKKVKEIDETLTDVEAKIKKAEKQIEDIADELGVEL
jgi:prefoldin subunit 5